MTLEEKLLQRYLEIVKANQEFLDSTLTVEKLSKLFLTPVPDGYENAENKIMIVGRETKDWLTNVTDFHYDEAGIKFLMQKSLKVQNYLLDKRMEKGARFFNFLRKIANKSGKEGVIWSNIYAFDYQKGHINRSKNQQLVDGIVKISEQLLTAQIEILKPDIIIFSTGNQGSEVRRKYFPNDTLTDSRSFKGIAVKDLWSFKLPNNPAICYRVHHPSARKKGKKQIETALFNQLPSKILEKQL